MFGVRDAEIVGEVARAGGFRAAGLALGLAPSAVSARVATVEQKLGATLFERSRRGARLTPAGRRFLEEADRFLALRDRIAAEIAPTAGPGAGLTGALRIGVSETIVHTRLPAMLARLGAAAPRVRIELSVDSSEALGRALLEDQIDVAVLMKQWAPRGAEIADVARSEIDWFAAPMLADRLGAGPLRDGRRALALEALTDCAVIGFARGTPPAREVERLLSDPRLGAPIRHGSTSLATMIHLTREGLGVGVLPSELAAPAVAEGGLTRLDFGPEARLSALEFQLCALASSARPFVDLLLAPDALCAGK